MSLLSESEIPPRLASDLAFLDDVYPDTKIEFTTVRGRFGPELIEQLSREWHIPKNYMFIGSPAGRFPYSICELGAEFASSSDHPCVVSGFFCCARRSLARLASAKSLPDLLCSIMRGQSQVGGMHRHRNYDAAQG